MRILRIITAVSMLAAGTVGCNGYGYDAPRTPAAVSISLAANTIEVGESTTAIAVARDQYGAPLAGVATYSSSAPEVAGISPTTGEVLAIAPGTAEIIATIGGVSGRRTITVTAAPIRINEIRPDGDANLGWVELFNPSASDVDLSGWTLTGADVFQSLRLPAGVVIRAGGYRVIDESHFPAGLRAADTFHLFSSFGVQVDSYTWTTNPATSYGRCADGAGPFVMTTGTTRGGVNACPMEVAP
jgi:hypothetical protein